MEKKFVNKVMPIFLLVVSINLLCHLFSIFRTYGSNINVVFFCVPFLFLSIIIGTDILHDTLHQLLTGQVGVPGWGGIKKTTILFCESGIEMFSHLLLSNIIINCLWLLFLPLIYLKFGYFFMLQIIDKYSRLNKADHDECSNPIAK